MGGGRRIRTSVGYAGDFTVRVSPCPAERFRAAVCFSASISSGGIPARTVPFSNETRTVWPKRGQAQPDLAP
jgi:hypothetical protein